MPTNCFLPATEPVSPIYQIHNSHLAKPQVLISFSTQRHSPIKFTRTEATPKQLYFKVYSDARKVVGKFQAKALAKKNSNSDFLRTEMTDLDLFLLSSNCSQPKSNKHFLLVVNLLVFPINFRRPKTTSPIAKIEQKSQHSNVFSKRQPMTYELWPKLRLDKNQF